MAWATPTTRSTGYVVTASNWNEIVNDLRYLKGLDGAVAIENAITLTQIASPGASASGTVTLYAKADGSVVKIDSTGSESSLGGGFARTFLLMGA
jgi:hypothetical protein